jgi:hypothetical protein
VTAAGGTMAMGMTVLDVAGLMVSVMYFGTAHWNRKSVIAKDAISLLALLVLVLVLVLMNVAMMIV